MAGCSSRSLRDFYPPGDTVEEDNYAMSSFIPSAFIVPEKLETKEFRLRMLSIDDVDRDFEAVTQARSTLAKFGRKLDGRTVLRGGKTQSILVGMKKNSRTGSHSLTRWSH